MRQLIGLTWGARVLLLALQLNVIFPTAAIRSQAGRQVPTIKLSITYKHQFMYATFSDPKLGKLNLLIDTGFEQTAIDVSIASKAKGNIHLKSHQQVRGTGSSTVHLVGELPLDLYSNSVLIFSVTAAVLDLHGIRKELQLPIDGILGWDFFQQWCTRLDYSHQDITLSPLAYCGAPQEKHGALVGEWLHEGFLLPVHLTFSSNQDTDALLHLDTGSDAPFTLNTQFRTFANLKKDSSPQQGHGIGGNFTTDYTELSSADLDHGRVILNEGPIPAFVVRSGGINNGHWWTVGRTEARLNHDGLIGNGLLQKLILTFDPIRQRIYVEAVSPATAR